MPEKWPRPPYIPTRPSMTQMRLCTVAIGINGAGAIVGGYSNNSGFYGFLDQNGSYTTINDPNATQGTTAYGINGAGAIVGGYSNNSGSYGFLDQNGSYSNIIDPNATLGTSAYGINRAGAIVGGYSNNSVRPKMSRAKWDNPKCVD